MDYFNKPLFVLEMANNHMGDVDHGIRIVQEFAKVVKGIDQFNFSIKLQHRHDTFIHPNHVHRKDHKLIKRFVETKLDYQNFKILTDSIREHGFITMCTPWDELSVDLMEELNFEIIKIASCSFNDWTLLEKVVTTKKPIIASTAGAHLDEIDQVVSFFSHREKNFAIMHCVGEYPCLRENLELNQIDLFRERYPDVRIGYSTHEDPNNLDSIKIAIAKGASLFEKHVGVPTDKYQLNAYSATPEQTKKWIESAVDSYLMCGVSNRRKHFTDKELYDIGILFRGAYAKTEIKENQKLDSNSFFLAMPNVEGQIVAKNFSKYNEFHSKRNIHKGEPLMINDFNVKETRKQILEIVNQLKDILKESKVALPPFVDLEISFHYGIDRFKEYGGILVKVINREYSKILLVMFPGQAYPAHKHVQKDESYHILFGDLKVSVDDTLINLKKGGVMSVSRGQVHQFSTEHGVIIEEIATTYIPGDSVYIDDEINLNKNRKALLTIWPEWLED